MKMDFGFSPSFFFFALRAEVSSGRGARKEGDCREGEREREENGDAASSVLTLGASDFWPPLSSVGCGAALAARR